MAAVREETRKGWLFGPGPDLLFGCGLAYIGLFGFQWFAGPTMRRILPLELAPFLALLLGTPHYGATLVRACGTPEDRRRYGWLVALVSGVLALAFVAGLHSLALGSFLVTLYLTWSPWHYTGQNYGVTLLLLRQRGVPVSPRAKSLFQASFVASYALVFLTLQCAAGDAVHSTGSYSGTVFGYLNLGIPLRWLVPLGGACLGLYATTLAASAILLLRAAPAQRLATPALVVLVQALWFLFPTAAMIWRGFALGEPLEPAFRAYAFQWIAVGHFLQYLWIAHHRAAAGQAAAGRARHLALCLLAGAALWAMPSLLFAPWFNGPLPFDMGLGLLTASVVNLHHFILDGVVWKSRPGVLAAPFVRDEVPDEGSRSALPALGRPGRALAWGLGGAAFAVLLLATWEGYAGNRALRRGDIPHAQAALGALARLGQDSPRLRLLLAEDALRAGAPATALEQLRRSLALWPTPEAWAFLASWYEGAGEWTEARLAYQQALALAPGRPDLRTRLVRSEARARAAGVRLSPASGPP